ncbi:MULTISPECIES: helix-turn-helix domain-containing protein [unclassified Duganella]|uniref:helix-turn-helix domain-containing protein n=1 Tax=unclassified Duganella TaxID=2636909 RepID=UPI0011145409|nr:MULTISPECIES: helix-turn-helix domain-containing protein [unclassified Duganella]
MEKPRKPFISYMAQVNDFSTMLAYETSASSTAHGYIKDAIARLDQAVISQAGTAKPVAFIESGIGGHGVIFGNRSVWSVVTKFLDPALKRLYAEISLLERSEDFSLTPISLKDRLVSRDSARHIANMLLAHQKFMARLFEDTACNDNLNLINRHGDSFHAVASILDGVRNIVGRGPAHNDDLISWCQFCFRRAGVKGLYCTVHSANDGVGGHTEYDAGKRIRALGDGEFAQPWAVIRSKRRVMLDSFRLVSSPEDITAWELEGTGEPCMNVTRDLRDFMFQTKHGSWISIAKHWDAFLLQFCPAVAKVLEADASSFLSWHAFVEHALRRLDNRFEGTVEPFWIFYMLKEADDWLSAESKFRDARRTDKAAEIFRLHAEGLKQVQIAEKLSLSKGYVSRILKSGPGT